MKLQRLDSGRNRAPKITERAKTNHSDWNAQENSAPKSLIAGPAVNPVQVFRTKRELHWEFLRLWTGFELSSSWANLPGYGPNRNRNILDFMRWPHIGLGAQDLNDIQGPKSFLKNSWK
jgi:hypothetical protein